MSQKKFLSDLKVLLQKHPDVAKTFLVEPVKDLKKTAVRGKNLTSGTKRCVRWGTLPGTGKVVCLEWADE
jgi:hypothetical protein